MKKSAKSKKKKAKVSKKKTSKSKASKKKPAVKAKKAAKKKPAKKKVAPKKAKAIKKAPVKKAPAAKAPKPAPKKELKPVKIVESLFIEEEIKPDMSEIPMPHAEAHSEEEHVHMDDLKDFEAPPHVDTDEEDDDF